MAVLAGALFLDGLDVSMVGMGLPSIDSDRERTTPPPQWVVSGADQTAIAVTLGVAVIGLLVALIGLAGELRSRLAVATAD